MYKITDEQKMEMLIELGLEVQTINCLLSINGQNEEAFNDLLYFIAGYHTFEQLLECEPEMLDFI